jgi:hypothetical protein
MKVGVGDLRGVGVGDSKRGVGRGEGIVESITLVEAQDVDGSSIIIGIVNFEIGDEPTYLEVFARIPLSDVARAPAYAGPIVQNGAAN